MIVSVAAHLVLAGTFVELTTAGDGGAHRPALDAPVSEPAYRVSLLRGPEEAAPAAAAPPAPARVARPVVLHAPAPASSSTATGPSPPPTAAPARAADPAHGVEAAAAQASAAAQAPAAAQSEGRSDFSQRLYAHIERFLVYPSDVRTDGVGGTAEVLFRMDRNGKVLGVWLRRTSGSPALDAAAIAAIWRAQPLPAIPADLPDTLDIAAPVAFTPSP